MQPSSLAEPLRGVDFRPLAGQGSPTAYPTCHAHTSSALDEFDLLVGTSSGEGVWLRAVSAAGAARGCWQVLRAAADRPSSRARGDVCILPDSCLHRWPASAAAAAMGGALQLQARHQPVTPLLPPLPLLRSGRAGPGAAAAGGALQLQARQQPVLQLPWLQQRLALRHGGLAAGPCGGVLCGGT